MPDSPVIDLAAIENLRALSPDDGDTFLREIVGIFLEDTPKRIVELHTSRAAGDTVVFIRAAHSIKGSASNLGATELQKIAELLEHQSQQFGFTKDVGELVTTLEAAYAQAAEALRKIIE